MKKPGISVVRKAGWPTGIQPKKGKGAEGEQDWGLPLERGLSRPLEGPSST